MSGNQDLQQKRNIEFRHRVASTRPSPELLHAQGASTYKAADCLAVEYRLIVKQRLATSFSIRRAFRRPRQRRASLPAQGPSVRAIDANGVDTLARDTPIPPALKEEDIDRDAEDAGTLTPRDDGDCEPGLATPLTLQSAEESQERTAQDGTTSDSSQKTARLLAEESFIVGDEQPPLGYFPPQRTWSRHDNGGPFSRPPAEESTQSQIAQPVPVLPKVSALLPTGDHPLPPLPSRPSVTSQPGLPTETEASSSSNNNSAMPVSSGPDSRSENDPEPDTLSPTVSVSTLDTTNDDDNISMTDQQAQEGKPQLSKAEPAAEVLTLQSSDSTETDSDDDMEPAEANWCALENEMDFCVGKIKAPKQIEQTSLRLFESGRKTWGWSDHISRYIKLLLKLRKEASKGKCPRVFFSQAYYGAIRGSPSIGLTVGTQISEQSTSELYAKDKTCPSASVKKPCGPDLLTNMVERRLLQFFKDHPDGAPITPAHIKRIWNMLDQIHELKIKQRNKYLEVQNQSKKKERTCLWAKRPANDDGTHLLRSKGWNSPLAEVISIDEDWPVGWETTMTQPERYKIAGKEKRDPMKRLLESLAPSDEDEEEAPWDAAFESTCTRRLNPVVW